MLASLPVLIARPRYCVSDLVRFVDATTLKRPLSLGNFSGTRVSEPKMTSLRSLIKLSVTTPRESTTSAAGRGTVARATFSLALGGTSMGAETAVEDAKREVELDPTKPESETDCVAATGACSDSADLGGRETVTIPAVAPSALPPPYAVNVDLDVVEDVGTPVAPLEVELEAEVEEKAEAEFEKPVGSATERDRDVAVTATASLDAPCEELDASNDSIAKTRASKSASSLAVACLGGVVSTDPGTVTIKMLSGATLIVRTMWTRHWRKHTDLAANPQMSPSRKCRR